MSSRVFLQVLAAGGTIISIGVFLLWAIPVESTETVEHAQTSQTIRLNATGQSDPQTSSGTDHKAGGTDPTSLYTHFRVGQRNVRSIFADEEIVWVGTSGGVIRYDTRTDAYTLYDTRSGLLAKGIFHTGEVNGRVVVGTYGGGMALFREETEAWDIYNIPQGLADAFVYDVLQLDNGDIWIATWSGANRVRGGELDDRSKWDTFTVENTDGGLPNDWVYGLVAGGDGSVWVATEGGLAKFDDGTWTNWKHENGLGAPYENVKNDTQFNNDPAQVSQHHARQKKEMELMDINVAYNPNYVIALAVDRKGTVWCGTWGAGLARFDGDNWRNYTMSDGLPGNHVFSLRLDSEGGLWIGTNNGLAHMEDEEFKTYSTSDGLFSNNVFSMAMSADGTMWIGSYGGVARVSEFY